MLVVWRQRARWALITVALCSFFSGCAATPAASNRDTGIEFVQLTDPHIFDGKDDTSENKAAFAECIRAINDQFDNEHKDYKFIVVSGDLGLEGLIGGSAVDARLNERARELAKLLSSSRVEQWYFLPGNNDLYDELPYTIGLYRQFIKAVDQSLDDLWKKAPAGERPATRVTAKDLCPDDDPQSGFFRIGSYVFIGFNDASFKNNNSFSRAKTSTDEQKRYVNQVIDRLAKVDSKDFAYIFYHIPEVDDPNWVALSAKTDKNNPGTEKWTERVKAFTQNTDSNFKQKYQYSAWLVADDVRALWQQVVNDSRVKGLFAGHFHDSKRLTYRNYDWMLTPKGSHYYDGIEKLWVCPPVALKFQSGNESKDTARGFREVSIADMSGTVTSIIYWYEVRRYFVKDPYTPVITVPPPSSFSRKMEIVEISVSLFIAAIVILGGTWITFRTPGRKIRP
ncbi:MAG: hypothetical protein QOG23_3464 [Blastocatellia bacterium]|jgi:3',5'-cyclic AMP phosphodiesterase CpdA|nr:hypothetical protein [Blastocatellia bacterium]